MPQLILSEIYVYPIKSLPGIRLQSWDVVETGFKYDRKWMLVDDNRNFLSQRQLPKMALINVRLQDNSLVLDAPGMGSCQVNLEPQPAETVVCTVWHDQVESWSMPLELDQWFSDFLELKCRLVYFPETSVRNVNPNFAKPDDKTAFSDGFPFLLISQASLDALNQAMRLDLAMIRFRPNLVVTGCASFDEDTWREIAIANIGFRLPKPCSRCAIPNVDPMTGEVGKEPLATLNKLRKWQNKVYFGQNAIHDGVGTLSVGDTVKVKSIGPNQPPI